MRSRGVATPPPGYHDIGGRDFGPVFRVATPMSHWMWESEAVRALMGSEFHPYLTLDKLRRTFETFGAAAYDRGFHPRRTDSMVHLLIEQGVITRAELEDTKRTRSPAAYRGPVMGRPEGRACGFADGAGLWLDPAPDAG